MCFRARRRANAAPIAPSPTIASPPDNGAPSGAAAHDVDADACAMHVSPLQLADPSTLMLSKFFRSVRQLSMSPPTSTYCPSQKSAPIGCEHCAVHPPMRLASQLAEPLAWQLTWQSTFASAVQLPLQLAWHCAMHDADGGVAVHCP